VEGVSTMSLAVANMTDSMLNGTWKLLAVNGCKLLSSSPAGQLNMRVSVCSAPSPRPYHIS
jgi:hypothetical protein